MVIFMLQLGNSQDKKPMYTVDMKLGEPQRQAVGSAEQVFLCPCVQ